MLAVCKKTRAEATEQIAVPRGVPWISGKRQPPSDTYALLCIIYICIIIEGSLEIKLPTIWTEMKSRDGKSQRREENKKEKVSEERRSRSTKR